MPLTAHAALPRLSWAPPQLANPATIRLTTGNDTLRLNDATDYIVRYPATRKIGFTKLVGGRNIVIIGGHGTIKPATTTSDRRNLYIEDGPNAVNRTVHIEGVVYDASGGGEGDGIAIKAPRARVQIQNVRIVGLLGQRDRPAGQVHEHADIIQPWGGVRELAIDGLTGSSTYQGLQLNRDLGAIGSATLKNVNLTALPAMSATAGGGYMLWLDCPSYPIDLHNVTITPRAGRTLTRTIWPDSGSCTAFGSTIDGSAGVRFGAGQHNIAGGIKAGPIADIVPVGAAGIGYQSPGYGSVTSNTWTPVAASYTGWGYVRSPLNMTVAAYTWNVATNQWISGSVLANTPVYVWPYASGWSWAWTSASGWRAIRTANVSAG
jgi:hypothetical protein